MAWKLLTNVVWITAVFIILQINVFCAGDCKLKYSEHGWHKDLFYLTNLENGYAKEGTKADLVCKKGFYIHDGANTIECSGRQWKPSPDDTYIRCARIECENPRYIKIRNGEINTLLNRSSGEYFQDSMYWVTCEKGYIVKGNPVRRCMFNGTHGIWSQPANKYGNKTLEGADSPPVCEEDPNYINYSCPDPHKLTIKNGKINTFSISDRSSEDYLQDSIYWVTCNNGFKPKGNPARRCLWDGTHGIWSQPADIYGEKLLLDGDSPPVCEVDPMTISMGFFIVIYLIGFIGTGCVVCMAKLKNRSIGRLIKLEITSRTKPCDWNFKRFWQGLLFAVFFFCVPIALLCEVCKRKLKTEQNDGQGQNQPLAEENCELAQTRQQLIAQIHQLTAQNQQLTEEKGQLTAQNQQITDEKRQLTTQNQQLTEDKEHLTAQNNQDIADISAKINEQISRTDELSGKVKPFVTPDETQQVVAEINQNTADDAQGTPRQTLLTQIDKLKVKHDVLSSQIDLLIVKFEEQIRQPSREGEIEELKGKIEELSNEKDTLKNDNEQVTDQNMRLKEEKKRSEEKYGKLKDNVQLKEEYEKKLQQKDSEYLELERKYTVDNIKHEHNAAINELENTLAREREHIQRLSKHIEDLEEKNNNDMTMIKYQINSVVADLEKTVSHAKDAGLIIVHTLADARKTLEDLVVLRIEPRIDPDTSQSNEPGELGVAGRR